MEAYDYDIDMTISEEDYPKSLRVDIIFEGENIPKVSSVSVLSAENDLYNEKLQSTNLSKYREQYSKEEIDDTKYMRYTGVINVSSHREEGETIYEVPTSFGYHITFGVSSENNFIREFPVLRNVIPDGADLIDILRAGSVTLLDNRITINDSKVRANLIGVDEVGIAYKFSSSNSMSSPEVNSNGWNYIEGGYNIDIKETYTFDTNIYVNEMGGNTFYVPYAKTKNGYFYGEVKKVENNWMGDVGANKIISVSNFVIDENDMVIRLNMSNSEINSDDYITIEGLGTYFIDSSDVSYYDRYVYVFVHSNSINMLNTNIRYINSAGLKSNIANLSIENVDCGFIISSKNEISSRVLYIISKNNTDFGSFEIIEVSPINDEFMVELNNEQSFYVNVDGDMNSKKVLLKVKLYLRSAAPIISKTYDVVINLY